MTSPHPSATPVRHFSIALLGLAALALSGCAGRFNATEKMMWSTYPLVTRKGMGTAFVIERGGGRSPALVTSFHALKTVGREPFMVGTRRLDAQGGGRVTLLQLQAQRGNERFFVRHPRHDLAAFALELPADLTGSVLLGSCLDERSLTSRAHTLRVGEEVSFLGFPEVLPGTAGAFPVLRTGQIASYPVGTPLAQGLFVINSAVYPGDSGAPVFVRGRFGRPELVGMIIRRVSKDERAFSHLAIAVEASVIRETLQLLAARRPGSQDAQARDPKPRPSSGTRRR